MKAPKAKVPADLIRRIARHHAAAHKAKADFFKHAIAAGKLLAEAKKAVGHGEWTRWLERNFRASHRTANIYVRLFRNRGKFADTANLNIHTATAYLAATSGDSAGHVTFRRIARTENGFPVTEPVRVPVKHTKQICEQPRTVKVQFVEEIPQQPRTVKLAKNNEPQSLEGQQPTTAKVFCDDGTDFIVSVGDFIDVRFDRRTTVEVIGITNTTFTVSLAGVVWDDSKQQFTSPKARATGA